MRVDNQAPRQAPERPQPKKAEAPRRDRAVDKVTLSSSAAASVKLSSAAGKPDPSRTAGAGEKRAEAKPAEKRETRTERR